MLYIFATKPAIKERDHPKYHYQMVFHITVPSNILIDMIRMPVGTLGIKFRDSKMFIRRNRLNRLMSYKWNYTNQTILYAFNIYQQRCLIDWEIDIFIFLPHISYTDTVLTVFWQWALKHVWTGLLNLHCLSVSNPIFSTLHIETNPLLYVASSSKC